MYSKKAEYDKLYRQRQREKGLCSNCARPVVPGLTKCQKHRFRPGDIFCRECNKVILVGERLNSHGLHRCCSKIRSARRNRQKQKRYILTTNGKSRHRINAKLYQKRHKTLGICVVCSSQSVKGHFHCTRHLLKISSYYYFGTHTVDKNTLKLVRLYRELKKEVKFYG